MKTIYFTVLLLLTPPKSASYVLFYKYNVVLMNLRLLLVMLLIYLTIHYLFCVSIIYIVCPFSQFTTITIDICFLYVLNHILYMV